MEPSIEIQAAHALLHMVALLHQAGHEQLRIFPSLSPSGMYWRCQLNDIRGKQEVNAWSWLQGFWKLDDPAATPYSAQALADRFTTEHSDFLQVCKGPDSVYRRWYRAFLKDLRPGDMPIARADWEIEEGCWLISNALGGSRLIAAPLG